jgi:hypothetical protein
MTGGITFSTAIIRDSIVNGVSSATTKDNTAPFSFLEFITSTNVDYTPEEYNKFYLYYLKTWSETKNSKAEENTKSYIDYYVSFLKELTITYSTQQEIKFLSTLDFNDPIDLDIAIPFYVEKIRQIIVFYKEKRDTTKYVIERNKLKGTETSIEKALFNKIYEYVFSSDTTPNYKTINYSLSTLKTYLSIDIEEFVDVYSSYFDLPKKDDTFTLTNRNEIDPKLYFEDTLQIFRSSVFLNEIPLAVNVSLQAFSSPCDPTNPIALLRQECTNRTGFTDDQITTLKKRFLEKYSGVDFHYIDTTGTLPVSGVLFRAANPTGNIQNLQTIDTPTIESNDIKLLKDLGLFFKPDKTGIFQLNAENYSYEVDFANLSADKIYIYPNPSVYGNVSLNKQTEYPLIFTYDYRPDIKNVSSWFAMGDPKVDNDEQTFSPYYAREQSILKTAATSDSVYLNFADLFNKGYITKYQTDVFGNEYAIFKDSFGQSFKTISEPDTDSPILNLLLNGHVFYDRFEGYSFNYTTESREGTTVRSGLSTLTVNYPFDPSSPSLSASFVLSGSPLYLYFRELAPYTELNYIGGFGDQSASSPRLLNGGLRDGGGFTFFNGSPLPDPISSSNDSYPGDGIYYYSILAEAGVASLYPPLHPTSGDVLTVETGLNSIDTESSISLKTEAEPDFTLDVSRILSAFGVEMYDCGYFTDNIVIGNDYNYDTSYPYYDVVSDNCDTVISALSGTDSYKTQAERQALAGKMFVKNQAYSSSYPLSTSLSVIFNKYSTSVKNELYENIKDFDIIYDTIIAETENHLVLDKIMYENESFIDPVTKNTTFTRTGNLNKFSNRFFNEKNKTVTFVVLDQAPSLSASNFKSLFPNIYVYNIGNNITTKVYPKPNTNVENLFNLSNVFTESCNFNIVKIQNPVLTYNSFNDIYKLTFIGEDNNGLFHVFDYGFYLYDTQAVFLESKYYKHTKSINTTNFTNSDSIFSYINPISGVTSINSNGALVL